ncbi:MAG TPA: hypothetical protein VJU61_19035 [Polyangiaceae bacterium]|nr:hypothetical protein [Polyangiaceae bacterium]
MARVALLLLALGLTGCGANCLRDSDCDDTHVCVHDSCVRPSVAEDASVGRAGQAGGQGLIDPSYPGLGGAGGSASTPEQGGAGGAGPSEGGSAGAGMDASSGGSATQLREILDASVDADADAG